MFLKASQTIKKYRKVTSKNDQPGEGASSVIPCRWSIENYINWPDTSPFSNHTTWKKKNTLWVMFALLAWRLWSMQILHGYEEVWWAWQEKAVLWAQKVQEARKVYSTWQNQCEHTLGHTYRQAEKALFAISNFVCITYKFSLQNTGVKKLESSMHMLHQNTTLLLNENR